MTGATQPARFRVLGLSLGLGEPDSVLRARAAERAGLAPEDIGSLRVGHKSLDARKRRGRRQLRFVVHADVTLAPALVGRPPEAFARALRSGRVVERPAQVRLEPPRADALRGRRVAVVGAGPAGLFAALSLARGGARVDLIDRGPELAARSRAVARFLRHRELDPEANLLFGEGGAGTYSDGKIYTRVDHPLEEAILAELVECGAPEDIQWDARAHIGTDRLHRILPALRARLEDAGVALHWSTRLEGWNVVEERGVRRVASLRTSAGEMGCEEVVLALGHSARDTLEALAQGGLALDAKPFQLGVRVEHPQTLIDAGRYGDAALAERLGPAYYGLTCKAGGGLPAAHSFCMCPGGQIVAAVNEPGLLCTNGMSNSRHSSPHANAAIVVTLGPKEFGDGAFAGLDLRERLERRFFEAGGGDWTAPAQRVDDFLAGRASESLARTSYVPGVVPARIDALLPESIRAALARALGEFGRRIEGFDGAEGVLVGIESRSSGSVRITRGEDGRALGLGNVLPVGEGAGYAGGIMSAAIDGVRGAWALAGD